MQACAWVLGHGTIGCPYVGTPQQCVGCKEWKQLELFV